MPTFPDPDLLERRYDGPIPPTDPAACRASAAGRARLFDRLAAEALRAAAGRRQGLSSGHAATDGRLMGLARTLTACRAHGVAWRD